MPISHSSARSRTIELASAQLLMATARLDEARMFDETAARDLVEDRACSMANNALTCKAAPKSNAGPYCDLWLLVRKLRETQLRHADARAAYGTAGNGVPELGCARTAWCVRPRSRV